MPFSAIKVAKGGAPYRGEGGLHGANHNEVEGNSVTISKDEKFSF